MILIARGTIVTIKNPDSMFDGTQGTVEKDVIDQGQEVEVKFGKEYSYLFGFYFDEKTSIVTFKAGQLKQEKEFTIENRVKRLFGKGNWHSTSSFKEPFDLAALHDCQREGCKAKAARRILVNIWGTVCEFETCEPCAERWHGTLVDNFPMKEPQAA